MKRYNHISWDAKCGTVTVTYGIRNKRNGKFVEIAVMNKYNCIHFDCFEGVVHKGYDPEARMSVSKDLSEFFHEEFRKNYSGEYTPEEMNAYIWKGVTAMAKIQEALG